MSEPSTPQSEPTWDPWAQRLDQPDPAHQSAAPTHQYAAPTQPATPTQPGDATQEVDLRHTQEIPAGSQAGTGPVPTTGMPPAPPMSPPPGSGGPRRQGPGWAAVLAIASIAALLAALGGGLVGALLMRNTTLGVSSADNGPTPTPGAGATARPEGSVANIAAKAMPSVVTIRVAGADGTGTGSGWVFDSIGHIVTNNHVVESASDSGTITVVLANGKRTEAKIIGRDTSYDLAVIKVDRTDLTPLPMGVSADVVVGDPVIAVGAPLGLDSTVTTGIVSALNRPVAPGPVNSQSYINAIQTDAAINPGNSGGPLLDMRGQVIGVNSAIARAPGSGMTGQSGNIGVGFAIPSDQVKRTVQQLIATGKAEHPVIGVFLDRRYDGEGVKIATEGNNGEPALTPNGPAEKAGLKPGDIIVSFDGEPIADPDALIVAIRAKAVGDRVSLTVLRDGKNVDVTMVLQAATE
jgi:putative serine protease PepD